MVANRKTRKYRHAALPGKLCKADHVFRLSQPSITVKIAPGIDASVGTKCEAVREIADTVGQSFECDAVMVVIDVEQRKNVWFRDLHDFRDSLDLLIAVQNVTQEEAGS